MLETILKLSIFYIAKASTKKLWSLPLPFLSANSSYWNADFLVDTIAKYLGMQYLMFYWAYGHNNDIMTFVFF